MASAAAAYLAAAAGGDHRDRNVPFAHLRAVSGVPLAAIVAWLLAAPLLVVLILAFVV